MNHTKKSFTYFHFHVYRFLSNYLESGLGFQIRYALANESKWSFNSGECGGNFTTPNAIMTSPSFPNRYPRNTDCIYIITQDADAIILLTFLSIDVEYNWNCHYDYIEIRDGPSESSPELVERLCGDEIPASLQSSQNQVWIK